MKLDKRIKSLSDVLTCYDIESAEQFIGHEGYFTDDLMFLSSKWFASRRYGTLTEIVDDDCPFRDGKGDFWRFFIPVCRLKPHEAIEFNELLNPKHRLELKYKVIADTKSEIHDNLTEKEQLRKEGLYIGNSFWIRSKDNTEITHLVTVTEISIDSKGSIASIGLGTSVFPPKELLKNYEWCNKSPKDNDWKPFSIRMLF